MLKVRTLITGMLLCSTFAISTARAQYNRVPESYIDPSTFQIDEQKVLGVKVDKNLALIDESGQPFTLGEKLGKPLILVLSYYTCDGSCSVINADLRDRLEGVTDLKMGKDFEVLTISFDKQDNLEKLGVFKKHLEDTEKLGKGWSFATFKDSEQIKPFADRLGFNYFWSPTDRTFFHPGAFLFLSAEGRLIRVLYSQTVESKDVELAVFDAKQGKFRPNEIINFATSLCYSYNYKEGRYTYNIPLFVAVGSLTFGVTAFSGSVFVFRRRRKEREKKLET
ncbi:MAG: SCO family protein [Rhodospirillaceae bacterium]|nr:SCO family protein [Rhodospirillaceae bacterium]MBL6941382.1 SCO family protein [Rhodospirillales bacterium]